MPFLNYALVVIKAFIVFTWLVDPKAEDVDDDDGPPFSHWNADEVEGPP